jgi:hypothetical protein
LDALLERTAVMNAPGTITAAELARALMQAFLETTRAEGPATWSYPLERT